MDERGSALERLHEVGVDRVLQEQRHRALRLQFAGSHGGLPGGDADDDARQAALQVLDTGGEGHDRHDLGARDDDEAFFARRAGIEPPQTDDEVAQGAVVHVDGAGPRDAAGVEPERVAVVQVCVEHGREEVVRARDGVEVPGEVEIDVLHGNDLRVATARRSPLHPEHRPERRLADAERGVLPEFPERLGHADGHGGLALAGGRGGGAGATAPRTDGSLRLPGGGTGARYGASVWINSGSAGQSDGGTVHGQSLNVIIPENEKYAPIATPASKTVGPELNECSTTGT